MTPIMKTASTLPLFALLPAAVRADLRAWSEGGNVAALERRVPATGAELTPAAPGLRQSATEDMTLAAHR
jgi:hypothetical protein